MIKVDRTVAKVLFSDFSIVIIIDSVGMLNELIIDSVGISGGNLLKIQVPSDYD